HNREPESKSSSEGRELPPRSSNLRSTRREARGYDPVPPARRARRVSETIVITTDDLEPAVRLRAGFESAGWSVELLTAGETLAYVPGDAVLLVLSGHLREKRAERLIRSAQRGGIPIIVLTAEV